MVHLLRFTSIALLTAGLAQAQYPAPTQGDVTLKDFRFTSGETLSELRIHYRTLGSPRRDAQGVVRNAVLIMHGTGGFLANTTLWSYVNLSPGFPQLLDASR